VTPESTIRLLLSGFTDARNPLVKGNPGSGGGTGPSMTSEWYSGSYEPLETALKGMHALGKQQSVEGIPLGTLWWYLAQRYLMSKRKAVWKVGSRTVDSMIRQRYCICGFRFYSTHQARAHIEKVHKPKPELVVVLPREYLKIDAKRREYVEGLAVHWIADWFKKAGITPRLPGKEKT